VDGREKLEFIKTILRIQPEGVGRGSICPFCAGTHTYYSCVLEAWLCVNCGVTFLHWKGGEYEQE